MATVTEPVTTFVLINSIKEVLPAVGTFKTLKLIHLSLHLIK